MMKRLNIDLLAIGLSLASPLSARPYSRLAMRIRGLLCRKLAMIFMSLFLLPPRPTNRRLAYCVRGNSTNWPSTAANLIHVSR